MSYFDELMKQPLHSDDPFLEGGDDEEKEDTKSKSEEEDSDSNRKSIADKVEDAVKDIEGVDLSDDFTDDFVSGDDSELEIDGLDEDTVKEVYKALNSALEEEDVEIEKDDDKVVVSVTESVFDVDSVHRLFAEDVEDDELGADYVHRLFAEGGDEDEDWDTEESGDEEDMSDMDTEESDDEMDDSDMEEYSDMDDDVEDECGSECGEEECGDEEECGFGGEGDVINDSISELENEIDDDDDPLENAPQDAGEEEIKDLDPVEDKKADDMLAMVATPMLLKDELSATESVQFYESVDSDIAVEEGLIADDSLDELYQEGVFASPNKPFKMTKQARMNQLYELSVQIEARAHRDPLMVQLDRAYSIERKIKKKLRQKYHAPATKRAKGYMQRLIKSKSGVMKNLAKKIK